MTRTRVRIGVVVLSSLMLIWCSSSPDEPAPPPRSHASTTSPVAAAVLVVSVDGLNPDAITRLGRSGAPNLHRLIAEGAATLNARTAVELTATLPNHTGMLTGRRVAGKSGHHVTFNADDGTTLRATNGRYVPGVFDSAHDHGLGTAFFAEKDKFAYLARSWNGKNGAADTVGADDGRDKTDLDAIGSDRKIVRAARAALADGSTRLTFLHLKAPDVAGHATGWLSDVYLEAVRSVDRDLGAILATVDAHQGLRQRVTILLTADHGGQPGARRHDDPAALADYRIPFIAWGRGVTDGADLYRLNPGRKDPGRSRPGYAGAQPIRNLDVADTALRLLGLPPLPGATASGWPSVRLSDR